MYEEFFVLYSWGMESWYSIRSRWVRRWKRTWPATQALSCIESSVGVSSEGWIPWVVAFIGFFDVLMTVWLERSESFPDQPTILRCHWCHFPPVPAWLTDITHINSKTIEKAPLEWVCLPLGPPHLLDTFPPRAQIQVSSRNPPPPKLLPPTKLQSQSELVQSKPLFISASRFPFFEHFLAPSTDPFLHHALITLSHPNRTQRNSINPGPPPNNPLRHRASSRQPSHIQCDNHDSSSSPTQPHHLFIYLLTYITKPNY